MTITQTVEIPADYRIFLELPRSVPNGVMARINIDIPAVSSKNSDHRDTKAFWKEFDRLAAASSDEILHDDNFMRTNSSRELELVSNENQ